MNDGIGELLLQRFFVSTQTTKHNKKFIQSMSKKYRPEKDILEKHGYDLIEIILPKCANLSLQLDEKAHGTTFHIRNELSR